MASVEEDIVMDLARQSLRDVNRFLHENGSSLSGKHVRIINPAGNHSVAVGLNETMTVQIDGHVGYYAAGMNRLSTVTIAGNAGCGVAENMMSGTVHVRGNASTCAGASAHGGQLFIDGNAASRCGISLKGGDIVVGGDVSTLSGFMAQAGRIVICGDAGPGLGDSLYEAVIYLRGEHRGLGADACEEPMSDEDYDLLQKLLVAAGTNYDPQQFKRIASARTLYHWNADRDQEY